ncbi:DUF1801 domain-containing protein [Myxococcota bacterium]|nr:DUF1801 domain-containing protein [Myxococcota bacterium]
MQSQAATPDQYVSALPPDRQELVSAIRAVINQNLPADVEEGMQYGMIGWYLPHRVYPAGYHCDRKQPVPYAGLASQKQAVSVYLCCVYVDAELSAWFQDEARKTGKRLDMGKGCVRFKKLADVPLDLLGQVIRKMPADQFLARYESQLPASARTR